MSTHHKNTNFFDFEALADYSGLIVHAYNNYLSSMMGFNELAKLESSEANVIKRIDETLESGRQAVDFGMALLASIRRLPVSMEEANVGELFEELQHQLVTEDKLQIDQFELSAVKNIAITTDKKWFVLALLEIIHFLLNMKKGASIKIVGELADKEADKDKVEIRIECSDVQLTDQQSCSLFEPFYSSRVLLGQKDIGLAKVNGFLTQTGANISWLSSGGFKLVVPSTNGPK